MSLKAKLYALDCTNAYIQWFEGRGEMTEEQRAKVQKKYDEACRRSFEYRFGRTRKRR